MKSFLKGVLFVFAVIAVIFIGYKLIYGGPDQTPIGDVTGSYPVVAADTEETDPDTPDTAQPGEKPADEERGYTASDFDFYYKQLNDSEKVIYAGVYNALTDGKNAIRIKGLTEENYRNRIKRSVYAMMYDHPEIFWISGGYTTTRTIGADSKISVLLELEYYEFYEYSSNPKRYTDELLAKVHDVSALAYGMENDYERVKYIFRYLSEHTDYDHTRLAESKKTFHSPSSMLIYTPYACLVENKAVCAGYAKAFKMLCNACGIECTYITGWGGEERHGWNCVKLDGDYYFVDATWGDSDVTYDGVKLECVNYEYLCMNRSTLELSHTLSEELFVPPLCESEKYDYFVYNGFLLSEYSDDGVSDVIERQSGERPVLIRFTNFAAYKETTECVYRNRVTALKPLNIAFSKSEDKYTIYIYVIDG